jgi:hypothetical protein
MTECRCRTEDVDCRLKCRCRTNFFPAFKYDFSHHIALTKPAAAVYRRAGYITFHYLFCFQCRLAGCTFYRWRNVGLSGISSVRYRNEQKRWCQKQSGTGIRGPSPVPECSGAGQRYRMPECRCPAMIFIYIFRIEDMLEKRAEKKTTE